MVLPIIWIYTLLSVFLVSLISFIGIITLSIKTNKLRTFLIYMISFSAGTLLGDAFLHLLPEIIEKNGFGTDIALYILGGITSFFVLEKVIHWRHCHENILDETHIHPFAYTNLVGDGLHNFLDGVIVAASYIISVPVGLATTLAVLLHEIPQEIGDFGVLIHAGFSKSKALAVNFVSALFAVLGAILALLLNNYIENLELVLTPLAIGGFIYIAGSDLIPELQKHSTKLSHSILQLLAFIAGILVMLALLLIE